MSGRPTTKTKTKENEDLVDLNPRPHQLEVLQQKMVQKGLGLIISFYTSMHNMVKNTLNRTLKLSSTDIGPCMRTHMVY